MADHESAMIARLRSDLSVTAIFGRRMDWLLRPQVDALPALTLQTIVAPLEDHLKGQQRLQRATVQGDVWAAGFATARLGRKAALDALRPPGTIAGVKFRRAAATTRDGTETQGPTTIYRASFDIEVWFSPA